VSRKKGILKIIDEQFADSPGKKIVKDYICNITNENTRIKTILTNIRKNRASKSKKYY
jgi:hypothetical protein